MSKIGHCCWKCTNCFKSFQYAAYILLVTFQFCFAKANSPTSVPPVTHISWQYYVHTLSHNQNSKLSLPSQIVFCHLVWSHFLSSPFLKFWLYSRMFLIIPCISHCVYEVDAFHSSAQKLFQNPLFLLSRPNQLS